MYSFNLNLNHLDLCKFCHVFDWTHQLLIFITQPEWISLH